MQGWALDFTVLDTYADATNKTNKYSQLSATHIFTPVAIITGDSRETTYVFQQLSAALQKAERGLI